MYFKLFIHIACVGILLASSWAHAAKPLLIHVFVALADNKHQGIVPVPAALGDGDNPATNLYWGAAYGMKTFFRKKSPAWKLEYCRGAVSEFVLERCVFSTRKGPLAYVVADAYRGRNIDKAMVDFMHSAAAKRPLYESANRDTAPNRDTATNIDIQAPTGATLSIYVGHNGLMDVPAVAEGFPAGTAQGKQAAVLACQSHTYFAEPLRHSGAQSLVLTYNLLAPEAYVVEGIVEGRRHNETAEHIRTRAAKAYAKYQKISEKSARRMFGAPKLSP